jgi:hypothetical protein
MELGGRRAGARAQAPSEQEQGSGLVQAAGAEQSGRAASCAWEQAAEVERCELAVELTRGWAGFSRTWAGFSRCSGFSRSEGRL